MKEPFRTPGPEPEPLMGSFLDESSMRFVTYSNMSILNGDWYRQYSHERIIFAKLLKLKMIYSFIEIDQHIQILSMTDGKVA